jgi:hypothetical protein
MTRREYTVPLKGEGISPRLADRSKRTTVLRNWLARPTASEVSEGGSDLCG